MLYSQALEFRFMNVHISLYSNYKLSRKRQMNTASIKLFHSNQEQRFPASHSFDQLGQRHRFRLVINRNRSSNTISYSDLVLSFVNNYQVSKQCHQMAEIGENAYVERILSSGTVESQRLGLSLHECRRESRFVRILQGSEKKGQVSVTLL